jgi:hypothetical protein
MYIWAQDAVSGDIDLIFGHFYICDLNLLIYIIFEVLGRETKERSFVLKCYIVQELGLLCYSVQLTKYIQYLDIATGLVCGSLEDPSSNFRRPYII